MPALPAPLLHTARTLNCGGRLVALHRPCAMGILNATPDSFFAGSRAQTLTAGLHTAERMLAEGATFLDIGGHSTRPNAPHVPEAEELARAMPLLEAVAVRFPEAVLSIDTFRSGVARAAVHAGATLVNDVSGGHADANMWATVAALRVPYIAMHMRGTPQTMAAHTTYANMLHDITTYFLHITERLRVLGTHDVLIDPGFGFAKTTVQNFELLKQMPYLQALGKPLVVGVSRKGMAYKTAGRTPETALAATTALHTLALQQGATVLRVHDVAEAIDAIAVHEAFAQAAHHTTPGQVPQKTPA